MKLTHLLLAFALLVAMTAVVSAQTYSANFEFHVYAINYVLHPGEETALNVLIENGATATVTAPASNISTIMEMISVAKNVRIKVESDNNVIKIYNGEQLLGDLPPGIPRRVVLKVKVNDNAKEGVYLIPVRITYDKIIFTSTPPVATIYYQKDLTYTAQLKIKIEKRDFDFAVNVTKSHLIAGSSGVVYVKVVNTGQNTLYNATMIINVTPPLRPELGGMFAYLGNIKPGQSKYAKFRLYVFSSAFLQEYPVTFIMRFTTKSGMPLMLAKTVGVKVVGNESFKVSRVSEYVTASKTIRVSQKMAQMLPQLSFPMLMQQKSKQEAPEMSQVVTIPARGFVKVKITNEGQNVSDAFAILKFPNPLLIAENTPYIGSLKKGQSKVVTFYVVSKAPPGQYLGYIIIMHKTKYGDEVISGKHYISVDVLSTPEIKVEKISTTNVGVGLSGTVTLTLKGEAKNLKLYMVSSDPITALSPVAYLEDLNGTGTVSFRVSVSNNALPGYYPVYVIENFDKGNVTNLVSVAELAVPVQPKMAFFRVVSIKCNLHPDSTGTVIVKIKNAGNIPVYNAVAILEVSTPLSVAGGSMIGSMLGQTQPSMYFIGTLRPNQTAVAKFRIHVSKDASAGSYPANLKVKYYDASGYVHESNSIVVPLEVTQAPPYILIAAFVIAVIGGLVGAKYAMERRKHGKER